jgi:hypothetical protein
VYEAEEAARKAHNAYVLERGLSYKQERVRRRWDDIVEATVKLLDLIEGGEPCEPPTADLQLLRELLAAVEEQARVSGGR